MTLVSLEISMKRIVSQSKVESITPTAYAVLSLFATRFAACAGGIWVTFIEPYLI